MDTYAMQAERQGDSFQLGPKREKQSFVFKKKIQKFII